MLREEGAIAGYFIGLPQLLISRLSEAAVPAFPQLCVGSVLDEDRPDTRFSNAQRMRLLRNQETPLTISHRSGLHSSPSNCYEVRRWGARCC